MEDKENVEKLLNKVEKMEEMQKKIDKKTKDAEAYKKSNEWLMTAIKYGIVAIVVFFSVLIITIGATSAFVAKSYFDYEQGIVREHYNETNDIDSGDGGVIINKSNNNSFVPGGK